jgi:hypothetical protein
VLCACDEAAHLVDVYGTKLSTSFLGYERERGRDEGSTLPFEGIPPST